MSSRPLIIASLLALFSVPATAGVVLDPQIFVGNPGSSNSPGGTAVGGEGNLLTQGQKNEVRPVQRAELQSQATTTPWFGQTRPRRFVRR
jgi:hypothetical protein